MALIDELKQRRETATRTLAQIEQRIADEKNSVARVTEGIADLDRAIAALEAPAQPVHPEAELRDAPPAASEESGDQSQAVEIPEGFLRSYNGTCEAPSGTEVEYVYEDGVRGYGMAQNGWIGHPVRTKMLPADLPIIAYRSIDAQTADEASTVEADWPTPPDAETTVADPLLTAFEDDHIVERAPIIDAQTCEEVDPRVSWKAEPEIPEGFMRWKEGMERPRDPITYIKRNGQHWLEGYPWTLNWDITGAPDDIIAYRIIEAPASEQDVLDATALPQVTIDKVPPTAEVIRDQDGRAKFALFDGQTREVVSGSGNPEADFWASVLHPKPKVDA